MILYERKLKINYEVDIFIAGGGIAGICAAVSAARCGKKVLLVERFGITGGNATSGGVAAFCGETKGQGKVFDEIITELEHYNAIVPYQPYLEMEARCFDHTILAFILQELLLRNGVKLLLHTQVTDCIREKSLLKYCIISGPAGPEAVSAKVFIDCSGEAILVHTAGLETMKDNQPPLPMAMMAFVRHTHPDDDLPVIPDQAISKYHSKDDCPAVSIWPDGPRSNAIKVKIPNETSISSEGITKAEIEVRRRVMQVLDYETRINRRNWMLDHCSPVIGIREGRRAVGDYILREEDLRTGRRFSDAIALGVFYLDRQTSSDKGGLIFSKQEKEVPPYNIPFRSLVVKNMDNLLIAGRCFSADQIALSSARVMTTCAMMGQAAGIGAAMSTDSDNSIRNLDYSTISKKMISDGAILN